MLLTQPSLMTWSCDVDLSAHASDQLGYHQRLLLGAVDPNALPGQPQQGQPPSGQVRPKAPMQRTRYLTSFQSVTVRSPPPAAAWPPCGETARLSTSPRWRRPAACCQSAVRQLRTVLAPPVAFGAEQFAVARKG